MKKNAHSAKKAQPAFKMSNRIYLGIAILVITGAYTCHDNKKPETHKQGSTMTKSATHLKTASGLEYEIITAAPAENAATQKGKRVKVHYTGWLKNADGTPGKKFDSSVDRGQPFEFTLAVGQVIAGWDEMVSLMKVGDKVRAYLPSKLGYGARGAGAAIPANADLVFDIEVLNA